MFSLRGSAVLVLVVSCLLFSACAPPPEIREEKVEYVWPLPPDAPRIKYLKSIWGARDLKKTTSALDIFAGEEASNDLLKPYGITTDKTGGRIFVTDTVRRLVFVFDVTAAKTSFIGLKEQNLKMPVGVAMDDNDRVYVSDTGADEVMVFSPDDKLLTRFGKGILDNPSGMAVDHAGQKIYVVSTKTHRVEVFSLDGKHISGFGGRGNGPGLMNFPTDIAIGAGGRLYVVDSLNFRVQIFSPTGVFEKAFGSLGLSPGQFSRPKGIAADGEGNLYVTDAAFNNFQIFAADGSLLLFVGSGGVSGPGEFSLPAAVHVDAQDRVYVADQLNRRVQIFQRLK